MIADLHIHYPMHLIADPERDLALDHVVDRAGRHRLRESVRALILDVASRWQNYRSWTSGERVNATYMGAGNVMVGFSVLYGPFEEIDFGHWNERPRDSYPAEILKQLDGVEAEVERHEQGRAQVVKTRAELERAIREETIALVHCVEGGFNLGATPEQVRETVAKLAERGVAYVTLAHLFWRHVATNSNALPMMSDRLYHWLFREPHRGLTDLGEAAVRAMAEHHVMVDVAHMSERALRETFDLLDEVAPDAPPVATHVATRQGRKGLDYNLPEWAVKEIADRGGVMGLIMGDHIATDGLRTRRLSRGRRTIDLEDSFDVLRSHIDQLYEWTGSHDHTGIGSDLDGFIKPTLAGIEDARDLRKLELAIAEHYGDPTVAERVCSGNALRLLHSYWRPGT